MQQAIEKRHRRMFTDAERAYCERTARPAGAMLRFAAEKPCSKP